ncbi:MAG: hypothetical protein N4A35_05000 [Flavobacteriales bacterium]|jgi:hypothetical protein|nr:hypothetical protein [Flavobacteriales bacterium]
MVRKIIGVSLGLLIGVFTVALIQAIGHFVHPTPQGIDLSDAAALKRTMESTPVYAFLIIIFSHFCGAFLGSYLGNKFSQSIGKAGLIIGAIFFFYVVFNLIVIPYHPIWYVILDILLTFWGAWIAFKITLKRQV